MNTYAFEFIRYVTLMIEYATTIWNWFYAPTVYIEGPTRIYFLSDEHEYDDTYTRVPEDSVYIEEWTSGTEKLCKVLYEGDEIPKTYTNAFSARGKTPWIWVGDRTTEIDLTKTFNKFLVAGNVLKLDLILKLIHVTATTNLVYIQSGTFDELKFPGDGIVIEKDDTVPDS